jgi:hypothetical protein
MTNNEQSVQIKQKTKFGCSKILLYIFIIASVYSGIRYFIDKSNYEKAHYAYYQANCETAIRLFDKVISSWRLFDFGNFADLSQPERDACQALMDASEKLTLGNPGGAIIAYSDFINNYKYSLLTNEAKNRIFLIFEQTNPNNLADEGFCDQISYLEKASLIPRKSELLPELLYVCGQVYETNSRYIDAVNTYDKFLTDFPAHKLASSVEESFARAIIADARESGAGIIPAPQRSGSTTGGSTVVEIQNDSPDRLRIVFSGPEARVEEITACTACRTYSALLEPTYCPELGPIGRFTLSPGNYDVVVQSISDKGVTPWTGNWVLSSGDKYSSCFFITVSTTR